MICLKYVKKNNVLVFGSNHIANNVQEDLINDLDYNYVGYISNNRSRATKYFLGNYDEMEKIIEEKDAEIKELKAAYKQELFQKVEEPLSHFKTLTKGIQTQEVLYDVELVLHISAKEPILKDILENQNNFVALGRSEDFIELLEMKEVELSSDINGDYKLPGDYSMYVNADCVNTDEGGMGDYFLTNEGGKKPAKGTIYYVAKDYVIEGKRRVFNKIACLYSSNIGIDESSKNALYEPEGGYIVNLN